MSFKQKPFRMKTFVESQFEIISVYEFPTKANSYKGICWVSVLSYVILSVSNKSDLWWRHFWSSVWSYLSLRVSCKTEFLWRRLLSLSLKLSTFTTFKQDICWFAVWSYVSLWVSNKNEFLGRHFFSLTLKLFKFTSYNQNWILMKTFVESQFEVM